MRPGADSLFVWAGATCSYGCRACPIDPQTAPAGTHPADLSRALAGIPARAGRLVVVLGGEPFVRPDLLHLTTAIRAAGCLPGIVTTGRPLLYSRWRERLRRSGLAYLRVQLFGLGESHDREVAVPGAFDQAMAGLQAWVADASPGCDVDVALNFRRRPLDRIASEVECLAREIASSSVRIVIALDDAAAAEPRDAEPLRRAIAALEGWSADAARPVLAWERLPNGVGDASRLTMTAPPRPFIAATPGACCLGAVPLLHGVVSASTPEARANSFNYVRTDRSVPFAADPAACTAHQAGNGADPDRQLWLVEGERLVLHVTDTGDFTPAEIARVKNQWSHLFLDRQAPGVLDDFTNGMRRVLPDAACDGCAHRARCGRRFEVVEGAPFAREEAWIGNYIAALSGRVLDVGCGDQLYRDRLHPLLCSGRIEYTGVDPDESSIARIRAALPQGRFHVGEIEHFPGEPASYDHILSLRSLNHVADLDDAFARMAELLAPGGALLIVECTPFALLRRPDQVAAADRAPRAGQQHFRNVSSDEVLPLAGRHGFLADYHHAVGLHGTNQWILLLSRADRR